MDAAVDRLFVARRLMADRLAIGGRQASDRSMLKSVGNQVCQMSPSTPFRRLAIAAWHATRLQPFFQQLDEHRRRFHLLLGGNVLNDGEHRTFDQHTKYCVGICTDLAGHADRLSEDVHRIGSTGGNPLNPADERFDCWERSVWHWDSIARLWPERQEHGVALSAGRCDSRNSRPLVRPPEACRMSLPAAHS